MRVTNILKICLGSDYENLAPLVQRAHIGKMQLEGYAEVERGNKLAQFLCVLTGMPPTAKRARFIVNGNHLENGMQWHRLIDDKAMNSWFELNGNLLVEKLGFIHMFLRLRVENQALIYSIVKTRIFGLTIPRFLAPKVEAREAQVGDAYEFRVVVCLPLIGSLIRYGGSLKLVRKAK